MDSGLVPSTLLPGSGRGRSGSLVSQTLPCHPYRWRFCPRAARVPSSSNSSRTGSEGRRLPAPTSYPHAPPLTSWSVLRCPCPWSIKETSTFLAKKKKRVYRGFPSSPVVKNPTSNVGHSGLIPDQGTKIPRAMRQLCTTTREVHALQQRPVQPK